MSTPLLADDRYAQLVHDARHLLRRDDGRDADASAVATDFALRDAHLLDTRQHRAWLELFTDDALCWVPSSADLEDPRQAVSYSLDDRRRLEDRVALLETGWAHAQLPPTRTLRSVSTVEAWPDGPDAIAARVAVVVWAWRRDELIPHPGRVLYAMRSVGERWLVALRVFVRIDADGPVRNVSFVL